MKTFKELIMSALLITSINCYKKLRAFIRVFTKTAVAKSNVYF